MSSQRIISFTISLAHQLGQGLVSLAQQLWQLVPYWPRNGDSSYLRLAEAVKTDELKIRDEKDKAPSIYKVPLKEELALTEEMISKQYFGEPGEFEDKVLLLVGATGAGKSTLVHAIANYIIGIKWEDSFRFKVVTDESQQNCIIAYTFYPMDGSALPYKLTVIDTPGFGSPEGLEGDRVITKTIEQLLSMPPPNGIDHLNGIGFVIQSGMARLTPTQEYISASIMSMFDLSQNIFTIVTFADSQKPPVVQALMDAKIMNSEKHYRFNNSVLFTNNEESEGSFDSVFWKMNCQSFIAFFADFAKAESVQVDITKEVLEERKKVQATLEGLNKQPTKGLDKIDEIREDERKIVDNIQERIRHLDEIALRPNPLFNVTFVEKLIESEKQSSNPGWKQRTDYLEGAKRNAEILSKKKRRLADIARKDELKITNRKNGTLAVYKLSMEEGLRNSEKRLAKYSIGKPGEFREKVLLVVGATGAGKSTLINGMVNYIMGVTWEDDFRFKLAIDAPSVSSSKSQTKDITAYTFYPMEGSNLTYKFTIIDTPGFGDTEGIKRDRYITEQLKEFFSIPPPNGIDHLDGIGFVTQASLARLTATQEYIFSSVLSIFGKDLSKNIFMMVTFADGQKPPVLQAIEDAKIPSSGKYFKFNNSALFADSQESEESFDAMFWKMGIRSIEAFFVDFEKAQSVCLDLTKEVLKERERLQTLLEGLNPQITIGLNTIEEMRKEEIVMQQREKEIETNKEFTYTVSVDKPRKVDISGKGIHTTTCLKCNFTCHNSCSFADDDDKYLCCAMNQDGSCEVCPGHCHWKDHKNIPYLIEFETVEETRTSEDLKKKYETATEGKMKVKGMLAKLDETLQAMHTKVLTMIDQAQRSLFRLDEIALKPNPLSSEEHLQLLIESEKQTAKHGWKQRVQYYEEAKRHAQMLSKVKDVKTAEPKKKDEASGDRWYSRFKFW
ncbi:uncharacterized protein [Montipora foliosa]|uniref:uncharacterized protein n=1 Tax=Montipora foliosa TaxID=591990 RepID=UPI0035F1134A